MIIRNIKEERIFAELQNLIFQSVEWELDMPLNKCIKILRKGQKRIDLRKNDKLVINIENILRKIIDQKIKEKFYSMQFPVNIRIVTPNIPENYLEKKFATDYLHCEAWTGIPTDILNCFLYIYCEEKSSICEIFEKPHDNAYKKYLGEYKSSPISTMALEKLPDVKHNEGMLYCFDAYQPHRTIRGIDGLRISIDFKLRKSSPYAREEREISESEFLESTPGKPGLGIYWIYPEHDLNSLEHKYEWELSETKKRYGNKCKLLREKYIRLRESENIFPG